MTIYTVATQAELLAGLAAVTAGSGGDTFVVTANITVPFSYGTYDLNGKQLTFAPAAGVTLEFDSAFTGSGSIKLDGRGTVQLDGESDFTGGVSLVSGTFVMNGAYAAGLNQLIKFDGDDSATLVVSKT